LDQIFGQVYQIRIGPVYSMKMSDWIWIAKISDLFNTSGHGQDTGQLAEVAGVTFSDSDSALVLNF